MSDSVPLPRRGRPRRHPTDVLFTQLWFHAVKARSGLPSAYAMELAIEPHLVRRSADGQQRPRKWDAYEAGRRVPSRRPGHVSSIERAEAQFPGTAKYLESPLRTLLHKEPVTLHWIDQQLLALPEALVDLLFEQQPASSVLARELRAFDNLRAQQLVSQSGFDALVAAVLLMKRAELILSPDLRVVAWEAYIQTQPSVLATLEVAPVARDIFLSIDAKFPQWFYLRPDLRFDVRMYTNALRNDSGAVDSEQIQMQNNLVRLLLSLDRNVLEHTLLEAGNRPIELTDVVRLLSAE